MKLYMSPTSPFVRKVRVFLREKGLLARIEEIRVDAWSDPQELLAANPLGKIPTLLLADGEPIYDSAVICAHLDTLAEPRLIPGGMAGIRALRREALADTAMEDIVKCFLETRRPAGARSATTVARWRGAALRAIAATEDDAEALETFDLPAITLAAALGYADLRMADAHWRADAPRLAAWFAQVSARPSMLETAPPTG